MSRTRFAGNQASSQFLKWLEIKQRGRKIMKVGKKGNGENISQNKWVTAREEDKVAFFSREAWRCCLKASYSYGSYFKILPKAVHAEQRMLSSEDESNKHRCWIAPRMGCSCAVHQLSLEATARRQRASPWSKRAAQGKGGTADARRVSVSTQFNTVYLS